jgi:hypothetical protein
VVKSFVSRHAALIVAFLALVMATSGLAEGAREAIQKKFRPGSVVRLDRKGKIPKRVLPKKVNRATRADRLGRAPAKAWVAKCPGDTVDLGTWCLMSSTFSLDRGELGRNDYFFAEARCGSRGGYVPTAGQLIAAADSVKLSSTIDDRRLTASIDEDATDGLKDRREMSSTLVTVSSGSSASGSIGVTPGSKGDPKQGEPDPFPVPRDPAPSTLQYVTVFDNGNRGGFAGSKPVEQTESFRCAFNKQQGEAASRIGG